MTDVPRRDTLQPLRQPSRRRWRWSRVPAVPKKITVAEYQRGLKGLRGPRGDATRGTPQAAVADCGGNLNQGQAVSAADMLQAIGRPIRLTTISVSETRARSARRR